MGLLDDVLGGGLSNAVSGLTGGNSGLAGGLLEMLGNNQSLQSVVGQFNRAGLGSVLSSWIGTGPNLPISADQISQVLSSDQLQQLAAKSGLSVNELSSKLSELMPSLVDKLTPNGQLPQGAGLMEGIQLLKGMFRT
jgi:uncharacterized protein YidB (DUF937 family)